MLLWEDITLYFVWFGTIDLDWNGLWLKDLVLVCNASTSPGSGIQKQSSALAVRVKLIQHLKKSHLETKILFRFAWDKLERAPPCFHIKRCYLICSICGSHCVSSVSCCNLAWTMPQSSGVSFLNDSFFLNTFFGERNILTPLHVKINSFGSALSKLRTCHSLKLQLLLLNNLHHWAV